MKSTDIRDPLEMAESMLKWGHLCPTAPDTLPLHPSIVDDVFVLAGVAPHAYLFGGQKRFSTRSHKETKTVVVGVPNFAESGMAVVLDKHMQFVPLRIKLSHC